MTHDELGDKIRLVTDPALNGFHHGIMERRRIDALLLGSGYDEIVAEELAEVPDEPETTICARCFKGFQTNGNQYCDRCRGRIEARYDPETVGEQLERANLAHAAGDTAEAVRIMRAIMDGRRS